MKFRTTLLIFFSLWILLYLLTNPMFCMEIDPGELLLATPTSTLTQSFLDNPNLDDNAKEIASYLHGFNIRKPIALADTSHTHDEILAAIMAQQARTPLSPEIFQKVFELPWSTNELYLCPGENYDWSNYFNLRRGTYLRSAESGDINVCVLELFEQILKLAEAGQL